jgi:glycine cleavage system H protein
MDMTPGDRKYTSTHEWVRVEGKIAYVGITDHAQEQLGDITFVEMPHIGEAFEQGDECAVIESVKAASDLFAPVRCEIDSINEELATAPETINEDPYDSGWIFTIRNFVSEDVDALLSADEYDERLGEEEENEE